MAAIELLEAYEYHASTFAPHNWEWLFVTKVPWLAIAVVLTELRHASRQADVDRGQRLVDSNFARYSDPSMPVSSTPMWQLLVQLRQHMQDGSSQTPPAVNYSAVHSNYQAENGRNVPFADDLMLDFGNQGGLDALMYNDQLILQDGQDLPWYVSTRSSYLKGTFNGLADAKINGQVEYSIPH
jgi:hypothetical protein